MPNLPHGPSVHAQALFAGCGKHKGWEGDADKIGELAACEAVMQGERVRGRRGLEAPAYQGQVRSGATLCRVRQAHVCRGDVRHREDDNGKEDSLHDFVRLRFSAVSRWPIPLEAKSFARTAHVPRCPFSSIK